MLGGSLQGLHNYFRNLGYCMDEVSKANKHNVQKDTLNATWSWPNSDHMGCCYVMYGLHMYRTNQIEQENLEKSQILEKIKENLSRDSLYQN